jgi:hypothetical protein
MGHFFPVRLHHEGGSKWDASLFLSEALFFDVQLHTHDFVYPVQ